MPAYNFNSQQYDPAYGSLLAQLPPCKKQKVVIISSELKPTKDGNGGYLQFILKAIDGPLAGREGFDNLNLHNLNAKTVEIANKQLSAYCHVTGVFAFQDTAQLHNIPFMVDVDWQKGSEPTEAKPEGGYTQVTRLYDINGNDPGKAGSGPARQAAPVAPPPQQPPAQVAPASPAPAWGQQPTSASPAPAPQGWAQGQPAPNTGWGTK